MEIYWMVKFTRQSAKTIPVDNNWSTYRYDSITKARQAAKKALGKTMGDSVTPIVTARMYRVEFVEKFDA